MVTIARHINDITLNPLEYVLDANKEPMQFESIQEARQFLIDVAECDGIYFDDEMLNRYIIE